MPGAGPNARISSTSARVSGEEEARARAAAEPRTRRRRRARRHDRRPRPAGGRARGARSPTAARPRAAAAPRRSPRRGRPRPAPARPVHQAAGKLRRVLVAGAQHPVGVKPRQQLPTARPHRRLEVAPAHRRANSRASTRTSHHPALPRRGRRSGPPRPGLPARAEARTPRCAASCGRSPRERRDRHAGQRRAAVRAGMQSQPGQQLARAGVRGQLQRRSVGPDLQAAERSDVSARGHDALIPLERDPDGPLTPARTRPGRGEEIVAAHLSSHDPGGPHGHRHPAAHRRRRRARRARLDASNHTMDLACVHLGHRLGLYHALGEGARDRRRARRADGHRHPLRPRVARAAGRRGHPRVADPGSPAAGDAASPSRAATRRRSLDPESLNCVEGLARRPWACSRPPALVDAFATGEGSRSRTTARTPARASPPPTDPCTPN